MSVLVSDAGMLRVEDRATTRSSTSVMVATGAGVILVAAPLGFGATSTIASLLLVAVSWLLLMAWLVERIHAGRLPLFVHPLAVPVALLLAFTAMHWVFYVLLFAVPVLGLLGYYFGDPWGEIHTLAKPAFIVLIVIHAGAALFNQFVLKDGTMARMLKPQR